MRKEAENWYDGALVDLAEAEDALAAHRPNWALFAAQQAVEKALKAAILGLRRKRPTRTHDLVELLRETGLPVGGHLAEAVAELTPYYSVARYPNAGLERPWQNISVTLAKRLVQAAKKVVAHVGERAGLKRAGRS